MNSIYTKSNTKNINIIFNHTMAITSLPIGHPKHEIGYDYEIEVIGTFNNLPFHTIHYASFADVIETIEWINSDNYTRYLSNHFNKEN